MTTGPRDYPDWRTRQPASPEPTVGPYGIEPTDYAIRDYADYYREKVSEEEALAASKFEEAKAGMHAELVQAIQLWGIPNPSPSPLATAERIPVSAERAEQTASYLYAYLMPEFRQQVDMDRDAGLYDVKGEDETWKNFDAQRLAEQFFYQMHLIELESNIKSMYPDAPTKYLTQRMDAVRAKADEEDRKAGQLSLGAGLTAMAERATLLDQDVLDTIKDKFNAALYTAVQVAILDETTPDKAPTRRHTAQWMIKNNLVDDPDEQSAFITKMHQAAQTNWQHERDTASATAPRKSFGWFLAKLIPADIAEGDDLATMLPSWAQEVIDTQAKIEAAKKPIPYLNLTAELGQQLEDLANIMRDTNPDPAANAPNPNEELYWAASDKRNDIFEQNTFSVTPEQKAQLEAAGTSVGEIFDAAAKKKLADAAARKATIEGAPTSARVEQALLGWFSEQNIWGNARKRFVKGYTDILVERYNDRLGKQLAQGMKKEDRITLEQSIDQDIEEGLIDPKMGEQDFGRTDTLAIDPVTGERRPLLFSEATDPLAKEYTPERIDEIVSEATGKEDAFAAFLRAKLADPKFKEQYRQEQAKARTEFAESPTMKAAFEQAYKGYLRGFDYEEEFVTPSIPPEKATNGYQPGEKDFPGQAFVDPDAESQIEERGEKGVVGRPTTSGQSRYGSLAEFYAGPGLRDLGRDVSFEDYTQAQMPKLKKEFKLTPRGRIFQEQPQQAKRVKAYGPRLRFGRV
jgi:hypothetical protein